MLVNPYPGMRSFSERDASIFFGRDDDVEALLACILDVRFLALLGASGCGKSSLIRAGLIPALKVEKTVDDQCSWRIAQMQPRGSPFRELVNALCEHEAFSLEKAGPEPRLELGRILQSGPLGLVTAAETFLAESERLLVFVDQFEELFRFHQESANNCATADETGRFVDLLMAAVRQADVPVYVLMTMRAEYLTACSQYPELSQNITDGLYLLGNLSREQMKAAIMGPAESMGVKVAAPLVSQLLNDLESEQDAVPCLQHTMMRMWEHHVRPSEGSPHCRVACLDRAQHYSAGLVRTSIGVHAEEVFMQLDGPERLAAEVLFRKITTINPQNETVRDPCSLNQIVQDDCGREEGGCAFDVNQLRRVIDAYRDDTCAMLQPPSHIDLADASVIDISHESLIRQWGRLKEWAKDEAEKNKPRIWIREDTKVWAGKDFDPGFLAKGARLQEMLRWTQSKSSQGLTSLESQFLKECQGGYGPEWFATHERLKIKALEWQESGLNQEMLLANKALEHAEHWLEEESRSSPIPVLPVQRQYINASRHKRHQQEEEEEERKQKEIERQKEDSLRAQKRKWKLTALMLGLSCLVAIVGVWYLDSERKVALSAKEEAVQASNKATASALAAVALMANTQEDAGLSVWIIRQALQIARSKSIERIAQRVVRRAGLLSATTLEGVPRGAKLRLVGNRVVDIDEGSQLQWDALSGTRLQKKPFAETSSEPRVADCKLVMRGAKARVDNASGWTCIVIDGTSDRPAAPCPKEAPRRIIFMQKSGIQYASCLSLEPAQVIVNESAKAAAVFGASKTATIQVITLWPPNLVPEIKNVDPGCDPRLPRGLPLRASGRFGFSSDAKLGSTFWVAGSSGDLSVLRLTDGDCSPRIIPRVGDPYESAVVVEENGQARIVSLEKGGVVRKWDFDSLYSWSSDVEALADYGLLKTLRKNRVVVTGRDVRAETPAGSFVTLYDRATEGSYAMISGDGRTVLLSLDKRGKDISIWKLRIESGTWEALAPKPRLDPNGLHAIALDHSGNYLAGYKDGRLRLWNLKDNTLLSEVPAGAPPTAARRIDFGPCGDKLALVLNSGQAFLFDLSSSGAIVKAIELRDTTDVIAVQFDSLGRYCGTHNGDGSVSVYSCDNPSPELQKSIWLGAASRTKMRALKKGEEEVLACDRPPAHSKSRDSKNIEQTFHFTALPPLNPAGECLRSLSLKACRQEYMEILKSTEGSAQVVGQVSRTIMQQ